MIRILFVSDTHLGFDLSLRPRVQRRRRGEDFFANFRRALAPALAGGADCVVHGGDLLYRRKVPPALVALAAEPLQAVAEAGVPVFLVPGNHERSVIPHREHLRHPNIHVFDRPRTFTLAAGGLRLALAGFPFIAGDVRRRFDGLLEAAGWRRPGADAAVLCLHQCVDGARVGPADYTFRGTPEVVDPARIPAGFAAVLAGHVHRHQVLTTGPGGRRLAAPVLYAGSVERTSFAERHEPKGYLTLEVAAAGRLHAWRFHRLPARPMVRLTLGPHELAGDGGPQRLAEILAGLPPRAVVQLRVVEAPGGTPGWLRAAALRRLAPPEMAVSAVLVGPGRGRWREGRRREQPAAAPGRAAQRQLPLFGRRAPKSKTEP